MSNSAIYDIKLLYVEDEADIREEMIHFLSSKVRELVYAENGEEGLLKYRSEKPDILLSDVMMPKMDGLTMVRHLKEEFGEIPVIVMTAFNESDTKMSDITDLNVDIILSKPTRTRKVVEAIEELLKKVSSNG